MSLFDGAGAKVSGSTAALLVFACPGSAKPIT
jgi:hypothetical protein